MILTAEFCTSFQKWKMLRRLMESQPGYFASLTKQDGETLRKELKTVNDHRNKFAHGELFVDARDFSVSLCYFDDGTKFLKIDETFLDDFIGKAFRTRKTLYKLHERFGTDLATTVIPPE